MGQLKITMPDELRVKLDQLSAESSTSVAEEIRSRVERTLQEDAVERPTRELMDAVQKLAELVKLQTGRSWHEDDRAASLLREAISIRLNRLCPHIETEEKFLKDELPPDQPVNSDDQGVWPGSLEAIESAVRWSKRPDTISERVSRIIKRRRQ